MGNLLAKFPQQRIRAGQKHPTVVKLEKLFDYMDDLGLEFVLDFDRILVTDQDRPKDNQWEIRDVVNNEFITRLPTMHNEYKITQDVDISPREAQAAPENVVPIQQRGTGLPVVKHSPPMKPKPIQRAKPIKVVNGKGAITPKKVTGKK